MRLRSLIPYVLAIPLALCLLVGAGHGAPPKEVQQAICRIYVDEPGGRSLGSGTLIGKDEQSGLVITCFHLFRESQSGIRCIFPNGESFQGTLLATDQKFDLAAIAIKPPSIQPIPLAVELPTVGETMHSAGFGSNHHIAINTATVVPDYFKPTGFVIGGVARQGDSGGPVINDRNELAGVLWGSDGNTVHASGLEPIGVVLTQCRGRACQPYYAPRYQDNQPQRPVPSRPQQPVATKPPSTPPPTGAAGCQCKGTAACKCDPKAKACACDSSKVAALEQRICQLELLLESGKLKGPKGDKGDTGPAGVAGAIGPKGAAADVVSAPVEIIRPDGTKKQLLWPLDGKHGLRLPLNMK